jgi:hypothetical protein
MNSIKQRIAIAEYLGYIDVRDYVEDMDNDYLSLMGRKYRKGPLFRIPDYLNDLNAIHEAEEHLQSHHLCYEYNNILYNILGNTVGNRADKPHHWTWHATAEQRAEAFLKTIGKWEDDSICFNSMDWKCKDEI